MRFAGNEAEARGPCFEPDMTRAQRQTRDKETLISKITGIDISKHVSWMTRESNHPHLC
jgi:hypothetical protein